MTGLDLQQPLETRVQLVRTATEQPLHPALLEAGVRARARAGLRARARVRAKLRARARAGLRARARLRAKLRARVRVLVSKHSRHPIVVPREERGQRR